VPQDWNLIIDVAQTPILDTLTILGSVTFSKEIDVELRAKKIFIRSGKLYIGSKEEPHPKKAIIHLHGKRNEDPITLAADVEGGNKIIGNLGQLELYGKPRGFKMTRLLNSANKGDGSLQVEAGLDIVQGDQLGLASSSYAPNAGDIVTVRSYNADTGKIVLRDTLNFFHWGADTSTAEEYNGVDMRTEVLLLTRSILVKGNAQDNWGCQIATADNIDIVDGKEVKRVGQTLMENVELFRCSQIDTAKAAIRFQNAISLPSLVKNCAIHSGMGWGAHILRSDNIVLDNNIFFKFRPIGVAVDFANNVKIRNNFVGWISERDTFKIAHVLDKRGGIIICAQE